MELPIAHRVWLTGQDNRFLRPRAPALRAAITVAALLDLIDCGAAAWDGDRVVTCAAPDELPAVIQPWADRLARAAGDEPIDPVHAIDSLAPGVWDEVGADAVSRGIASDVPHRLRRWLPPRQRPDLELARSVKRHLRDVVDSADDIADRSDEAVLAVGWSAGVLDEMLSLTDFADGDIAEAAGIRLGSSTLVRRLEEPVVLLTDERDGSDVATLPDG